MLRVSTRRLTIIRCGVALTLIAILLLTTLVPTSTATPADPPPADTPWIDAAPHTALIKLRPGTQLSSPPTSAPAQSATRSDPSLTRILGQLGTTTLEPLFAPPARGLAAATAATTDQQIYRLTWDSPLSTEQAIQLLADHPAVLYAEPDYYARPTRVPNDANYGQQWALPKINAPAAWNVSTGESATVIAIIDSGIDLDHPDFANRLWVNPETNDADNGFLGDTNGWNFVTNSANLSDANGHGSEVSGVAAATGNNGLGIAGLCWQCQIMPVVAMQPDGLANYSDIARAIQYAASNGADVINLSLGGYAESATLREAIREAAITTVIVAGAGNEDSSRPFYPAAYPEVLAVAAVDSNDTKATFSNYGPWVDLAAPGVAIHTTSADGDYVTAEGTSLAAPFVAGLAALIKSANPTWSAEQVGWQLRNTSVAIDTLNPTRAGMLGSGRIDAGAAMTRPAEVRLVVERTTINGQSEARPDRGVAFDLAVSLRNQWLPVRNLVATLSSSDSRVAISDGEASFGDIAPGQLGSNTTNPFRLTIADTVAYSTILPFTLSLREDGGYSLDVAVTLQVRSALEQLGGRVRTNTTWRSEKRYLLTESVVVESGVTLTIEPGTQLQIAPGKFLRIEGTLLARGTAEQPIVFTSSSTNGERWSGLSLTDSAVAASFAEDGSYATGSILEHVALRDAEIALTLASRAPYIVDTRFRNNGIAINAGTSAPRMLRSSFADGSNGIILDGGAAQIEASSFQNLETAISGTGNPLIRANRFLHNTAAINLHGDAQIRENQLEDQDGTAITVNGSPQITDNRIVRSAGSAIAIGSGAPRIMKNEIVDNGDGISASNLTMVDIADNLIAGNHGTGLTLEVSSTGTAQEIPALLYNPDTNRYLVAWREAGTMKAQHLSAEGQPLGNTITIATQLGDVHDLRAVYQPARQRYLLVWSGSNGVQGRFLGVDDQVPDGLMTMASHQSTQLRLVHLPLSDRFLIAFQHGTTVNVQRLDGDGNVSGAPLITNEGSVPLLLGDLTVDPSSDRVLLIFQATLSHWWETGIRGVWIDRETQLLVSEPLRVVDESGNAVTQPTAAFNSTGQNYALLWGESSGSSHRLMSQTITQRVSLPLATLSVAGGSSSLTAMGWVTRTVTATATQPYTRLRLSSFTSGAYGTAIDALHVEPVANNGSTVAQVSVGWHHTCAVTTTGTLRCWGNNDSGQTTIPSDLGMVSQVRAGWNHTCAVTTTGMLRCWGDNTYGKTTVPSDLGSVSQVSVGGSHTCAVTTTGTLRCWGWSAYDQTTVPSDLGSVSQVSTGWNYTCATTTVGALRCWGWNEYGQTNVPSDLGLVNQVSVGVEHTCAVTTTGTLRCWGWNDNGQTTIPSNLDTVRQISVGVGYTCAVTVSGTLRCWGRNDYGQTNIPVNPGTINQVSAGGFHTCAVTTTGTLRCWGWNDNGQTNIPNELNSLPLRNGSIELPKLTVGTTRTYTATQGFTNWSLSAGSIALVAEGQAFDGQQWLALNGDGPGSIFQDLVTTPGTTYTVTLALAPEPGGGSIPRTLELSWGTPLLSPTLIFSASVQALAPRMISGNESEFLVNWGGNALYAQRLRSNGTSILTPTLIVAPVSGTISSAAMAYNSTRNDYLLIWADSRSGSNLLWGQRLSANGERLDSDWSILNETTPGVNFRVVPDPGVRSNTITNNQGIGLSLRGAAARYVTITNNNLFDNGNHDLSLTSSAGSNFQLDARGNFWKVAADTIGSRVSDCHDDIVESCGNTSSTLGELIFIPPLTTPVPRTPAFARTVTLTPAPVGKQRGSLTVEFSAPIHQQTLPELSFYDARRGTTKVMQQEAATTMARDALGRLWFGTSNGLHMYDGRQWKRYTSADGLGSIGISAIYGASNGDLWVGHNSGDVSLSRLRGSSWTTYPRNLVENVSVTTAAISEDTQGRIWVGDGASSGAFRYDGTSWQRFTTSEGLAGNQVSAIVRDSQGRLWFRTNTGLSLFDGISWITYNQSNGLPTSSITGLYADRQGQVWAGLGVNSRNESLAVFDGTAWKGYRSPGCTAINAFTESSDGVIWIAGCGTVYTYDGTYWSNPGTPIPSGSPILFDNYDHFWFTNQENKLAVRWRGLDYPFIDGRWLTTTAFEASYDFTPLVPPGYYRISATGAEDINGMGAYGGSNYQFQVDFGAGVSLDPPAAPAVSAQSSGNLTSLSASWSSSSTNIDQYRYAIGTAPNARNVIGWSYLAGTNFTRNDLNLIAGQRYYVMVQARNSSGLWSVDGVSNAITAESTPTLSFNYLEGAPGSSFLLVGSHFSAGTSVQLRINGVPVGSMISVGADGGFRALIATNSSAAEGYYILTTSITVTPANLAQTGTHSAAPRSYRLDRDLPTRTTPNGAPAPLPVPADIPAFDQLPVVYLPLVQR